MRCTTAKEATRARLATSSLSPNLSIHRLEAQSTHDRPISHAGYRPPLLPSSSTFQRVPLSVLLLHLRGGRRTLGPRPARLPLSTNPTMALRSTAFRGFRFSPAQWPCGRQTVGGPTASRAIGNDNKDPSHLCCDLQVFLLPHSHPINILCRLVVCRFLFLSRVGINRRDGRRS